MRRHVRLFVLLALVMLVVIPLVEQPQKATVSFRSDSAKGSVCGSVVDTERKTRSQTIPDPQVAHHPLQPTIGTSLSSEATFIRRAAGLTNRIRFTREPRNGGAPKIVGLPENYAPPPVRSLLGLAETVNVAVGNNFFNPASVNINPGDTVRWTWGASGHSVTSGNCCTSDGSFCSPNDVNCAAGITSDEGEEYSHTFNTPGTFRYFCSVHGSAMTGVVTVAGTVSSTIQFSVSSASVTETLNATTKVDLNVTRSGDSSGAASVNYASSDGTASERTDYLTAVGTLRFAAGETSKTITVFIVDDAFGEGPETFNLTLSSPVGATLGSPAAATITINSNESVNGANPVLDPNFSSDFFVRQHYVDFFNREADAPGLAFWKNQIDECVTQECREIRRINVSAAFFLSIEFQQTGYLVYKANQAAFNSGEQLAFRSFLADTQEIGRGVIIGQPGADQQLEANKQKFFLDFVQRSAFLAPAAYPTTLTAAQFVDKLNANTFDPRNPGAGALTQGERDALVNSLLPDPASPGLRAAVLRSVSENGLFSQRQSNKAFVLMQYFGYLRRNPNDAPEPGLNFDGYNFWLAKLNQFNGNFVEAEMVKAFIISTEYTQRFGP